MRSLAKECDVSLEELLDRGGSVTQIPSSALLNTVRESIQSQVLKHVKQRTDDSDKLLRELQKMKGQNRNAHEQRERERAADKEAEERKHKLKKVKKREPDEDRPLAVGAHGVARQDGVDVHKGERCRCAFSIQFIS